MNSQQTVDFPECQLIPNGLDLAQAEVIGNAYHNQEPLPRTGDTKIDRIIERLESVKATWAN